MHYEANAPSGRGLDSTGGLGTEIQTENCWIRSSLSPPSAAEVSLSVILVASHILYGRRQSFATFLHVAAGYWEVRFHAEGHLVTSLVLTQKKPFQLLTDLPKHIQNSGK